MHARKVEEEAVISESLPISSENFLGQRYITDNIFVKIGTLVFM